MCASRQRCLVARSTSCSQTARTVSSQLSTKQWSASREESVPSSTQRELGTSAYERRSRFCLRNLTPNRTSRDYASSRRRAPDANSWSAAAESLEILAAAVDEGRARTRSGAEPPPLTAQGVVGGVLSVIHARLIEGSWPPLAGSSSNGLAKPADATSALVDLVNPLMAMIVLPYLGPAAAQKELECPAPSAPRNSPRNGSDPFKGLPIRFTYRTARVLDTIASEPGASNRHIADTSGIADEGQMSRLLRRLESCELIENHGEGHIKGEPNAWALTERGQAIQAAIAVQEPAAWAGDYLGPRRALIGGAQGKGLTTTTSSCISSPCLLVIEACRRDIRSGCGSVFVAGS